MMRRAWILMAAWLLMALGIDAQTVQYQEFETVGGLRSLSIAGDSMNWIVRADGTQYAPVTSQYAWGQLLRLPQGISCKVKRQTDKRLGDLMETYTLRNTTKTAIRLTEASICTPWNDNYPDAQTCMTSRCNAHIWTGAANTYVCALRMNGRGPHLGLMLTEGEIGDYEVLERGPQTGHSNFRGVLALCLPDTTLLPGQSLRISWRVFVHQGKDDFEAQLLRRGGVMVGADKYVCPVGDTIRVSIRSTKGTDTVLYPVSTTGDQYIPIIYNKSRRTFVEVRGISSPQQLLAGRIQFILDHQQMLDTADVRYGAFMVYDNEGDSILTRYTRSDLDEGRERVGMGILQAAYALNDKGKRINDKLATALERYARFIREKLQDSNYKTRSSLVKQSKNRGYNYAWVSDFYFRMYQLTGNRQYARDGYGTLRALYRQFGHEFYCIDYPVTVGLAALERAGMTAERDSLLNDFRQTGDLFVRNGLQFPKFEVNYEQSIIAPAVQFLSELYLVTREQKYLDGARLLMPTLDAFSYRQPSCYMNDIAIRHWDGYWFGKRQTYGDTYPHYWSAITAGAFYYYSLATGDRTYRQRAENIVLNNLVLFEEDGHATCAILRPLRVNGLQARYRDAFANDQDWALIYYLTIFK